jgi:hypothetical protein
VRRGGDCQPQGGRELGLEGMANRREPLSSRRNDRHAKGADRHGPKGAWSGGDAPSSSPADGAPPAVRRSLNPPGVVCVRNVVSPTVPSRDVESHPRGCTDGRAGKGCRRKRMPAGNRPDRGSSFAPTRKGAHFRQVSDHERGVNGSNRDGNLDGVAVWHH